MSEDAENAKLQNMHTRVVTLEKKVAVLEDYVKRFLEEKQLGGGKPPDEKKPNPA